MKIVTLKTENLERGCVTDERSPRFSFALTSGKQGTCLSRAEIEVNGWKTVTDEQVLVPYKGRPLQPFTEYTVTVTATDNHGETDTAHMTFETGRMDTPWQAKWISDAAYRFTEKGASPVPMVFRRRITAKKAVRRARIYSTAMGMYELTLNGSKVGKDYFAPGFTSYYTNLQYQTYDVGGQLRTGTNELIAVVAGGWAVGAFVWTRKNRIYADRQALLLELRIEYEDGTEEVIGTDESWEVTEDGNYRMCDIYDGETYDARVDLSAVAWRKASPEKLRIRPAITATYGQLVRAQEHMLPVSVNELPDGGIIYDFGQNFAGVVQLRIRGAAAGQTVIVRHAELLDPEGRLFTAFLRSAKCTATYICREGDQEYSPRLTYMGFRYVEVKGIAREQVDVSALALYSDLARTGEFTCSDERLNQLQSNIVWSAKSNFVDIPTDCPQRDERMGWTGDIAVFAPTACYNFDMSRFLEKWLKDVKNEQLKTGGIPNTVPVHGYGFPVTMPVMAMAFWGDACILVPWAEYRARGDKELLRKMYPTMKKYVKACRFWAGLGFGKHRYIWHTPAVFNFGDWVAPDLPKMQQWQARSKWTATASLKNTSGLLAEIAEILGEKEDAKKYRELSEKVADAYRCVFTDGNGKLKTEFQTAYVLPLQFDIFEGETKKKAAENLAALVKKNDYCIGTGFPGTPYILFALADNGQADTAFRMLMNDKCPSWLYEVKVGATTVWERWDGLAEDGTCHIGKDGTAGVMISYNHYASGAVGNFLYSRIAGIEAIEPGYKKFAVKPLVGGGLTHAAGRLETPYGIIESEWRAENGKFVLCVHVPVSTECEVTMPDGEVKRVGSGEYRFEQAL